MSDEPCHEYTIPVRFREAREGVRPQDLDRLRQQPKPAQCRRRLSVAYRYGSRFEIYIGGTDREHLAEGQTTEGVTYRRPKHPTHRPERLIYPPLLTLPTSERRLFQ